MSLDISPMIRRVVRQELDALPEYLSMRQAAEIVGVNRRTIARWISAGTLTACRPGGGDKHRTIRIRREDLERCLQGRR